MKSSLFYLIFGSLVITIILQAILFASTGVQSNKLQKQLTEVNQKLDRFQNSQDSVQSLIRKIGSFIDEPIPEDSAIPDATDPGNLLSPDNLNKTIGNEAN